MKFPPPKKKRRTNLLSTPSFSWETSPNRSKNAAWPSNRRNSVFVASLDQMQLIIPRLSPATLEFGIHLDTDLQSVENCPLLVRTGQVTERVVGWFFGWLVGWFVGWLVGGPKKKTCLGKTPLQWKNHISCAEKNVLSHVVKSFWTSFWEEDPPTY